MCCTSLWGPNSRDRGSPYWSCNLVNLWLWCEWSGFLWRPRSVHRSKRFHHHHYHYSRCHSRTADDARTHFHPSPLSLASSWHFWLPRSRWRSTWYYFTVLTLWFMDLKMRSGCCHQRSLWIAAKFTSDFRFLFTVKCQVSLSSHVSLCNSCRYWWLFGTSLFYYDEKYQIFSN